MNTLIKLAEALDVEIAIFDLPERSDRDRAIEAAAQSAVRNTEEGSQGIDRRPMTPRHAEPKKDTRAKGVARDRARPSYFGGRPSACGKACFQFRLPLELVSDALPILARFRPTEL